MAPKSKFPAGARLTHPIRRWRIVKGYTIEEAIEQTKTQVTREAWRQWETGETPSDLKLALIAKRMAVRVEVLAENLERWNRQHAPKKMNVGHRAAAH